MRTILLSSQVWGSRCARHLTCRSNSAFFGWQERPKQVQSLLLKALINAICDRMQPVEALDVALALWLRLSWMMALTL